jgi:hypothetical protein
MLIWMVSVVFSNMVRCIKRRVMHQSHTKITYSFTALSLHQGHHMVNALMKILASCRHVVTSLPHGFLFSKYSNDNNEQECRGNETKEHKVDKAGPLNSLRSSLSNTLRRRRSISGPALWSSHAKATLLHSDRGHEDDCVPTRNDCHLFHHCHC